MIRLVFSNIGRFIILVTIQIVLMNNITLHNIINPYIYVLFLLLLPLDLPAWALLNIAFLTGLTVDIFSDTAGMHAAACVFMVFCRPFVLSLVTPRGGYEHEPVPAMKQMGTRWFITYASILIVLHHLVLFNIEIFRMSEFFVTLLRILFSSAFTLAVIVLSQYLFTRNKVQR